ncbi:hypothetical protein [Caulobacter hibisci]|uniref:MarR family transcriptional regulator n=1 Tax=Caulobacter hibisci TaxID=2035993 RepID=A0ABS0T1W0_9CAUL|nr:hypothetical protein [Caulobacter hibisci]MBI1684898.1 hypothetical protein [Caulobacter hibisci]
MATINSMHADLEARLLGTLTPFERAMVFDAINELAGLAVSRLAADLALRRSAEA